MDIRQIPDGKPFVVANEHGIENVVQWFNGDLYLVGAGLGTGRTTYNRSSAVLPCTFVAFKHPEGEDTVKSKGSQVAE